ncbi:MAG: DUF6134 family protein [Phenylobacterium sp.]|uniref:DUF6134 family protein n=1 Tax=Phenylobacterium sp. TaxID=1871053 RepID=UPI00391A61A4
MPPLDLSRRALLAAGLGLAAPAAWAAPPAGGRLAFVVLRNGAVVGEHHMTFAGSASAPRIVTEVEMAIRLGPVPVFRYRHTAEERWSEGRFAALETRTDANGRRRAVEARRTEAGVLIEADRARIAAPADAAPLTHWNSAVLRGPLFNPQEGKLLRLTSRRVGGERIAQAGGPPVEAVRWSLRGDAEIDDWYDGSGVWAALSGRLPDGSTMTYRRKA